MSFWDYLKSLATPGNFIAGLIMAIGIPLIAYRFLSGLGATTNLSQTNPWGIWIGFDMLSGVALAAGGYTLATSVYIFGLKEYHPIVRPAVLTGFLGYLFAVLGLTADLGRPWNLPVPIFFSWGGPSVMFEIAWCVVLYLSVLGHGVPAAGLRVARLAERAHVGRPHDDRPHGVRRDALDAAPVVARRPVPDGADQAAPALVLALHPGVLLHLQHRGGPEHGHRRERAVAPRVPEPRRPHGQHRQLALGLARGASVVLFSYFFVKLQGVADGGRWSLLNTGYGYWFLVEMLGFILLPSLLFAYGARHSNVTLVRWTAAWTVLGIIVNRLNVSVIAMNWNAPERYVPSFIEVMVSITLVTIGISTFRWIVNRMPVLKEHPDTASQQSH